MQDQTSETTPSALKPPPAAEHPHVTEIHGRKLVDPYFWMRDKENPKVMKHLEAENAYTEAVMVPTKKFQEELYNEFLSRIQQTDTRPPYPYGDFEYFTGTEEGKQYPTFYRSPKSDPKDAKVVLDLNVEAEGHKFMSIGIYDISDDGNWLAYALDVTGYRQYTLRFKDLRSNEISSEIVERVTSFAFCPDNKTFFYTTEDDVSKRSDQFWRWSLGGEKPELILEETDELYSVSVDRSREGKMLFLNTQSMTSSEVRYAPADKPDTWTLFREREEDHEYYLDHRAGTFYVRTNLDAVNFKVVTASESDPSNWVDLPAYTALAKADPGAMVEAVSLFESFLVLWLRTAGSEQLQIVPDGGQPYLLPLPEPIHSLSLEVNMEFSTRTLRYHYQSPLTPPTVFRYDLDTNESVVLKQDPVLGGFQREDYVCERVDIPARDGTPIPVSIVYRAALDRSKPQPALLYGYGSYGVSIDPTFSSVRLSLLQRGAIFAIAHIRGGGEMGEPWRQAGRMEHKMNTFHDFIDCAEGLIKLGYTAPDRLAITGGSAGGLLMGVVSNLRPDLFAAVVSKVPFVDVINTMLDASLPLTTGEYIEWGNPNELEAFERMIAYSPYDNVKPQPYPCTLMEVSYYDSQVPFWEGAKLVAKMRAAQTNDEPILLKTNLDAGHGGASGRYDALKEAAFDYAFLLWKLGLWSPA